MKNNKKIVDIEGINAFTLVELLAVIVIIGLLSVIIIPKITKTINDSKKEVAKDSASALVRVANNYYLEQKMKNDFEGCSYNFTTNVNTCNGLQFSGEKPDQGILTIEPDGNIAIAIQFDDYCYKKNFSDDNVLSSDYNSYDCIVPQHNSWDGTSLEVTEVDNTYYIADPRQLAWISEQTNSGTSFEGKKIVLVNDINFGAQFDENGNLDSNSHSFTPIGQTEGNEFKGNFDGNNHKISNLYIKETGKFTGLFGRYYGPDFKNLTVENSYIYSDGNVVGIIGGNRSTNTSILNIENIKSINNTIVSGGSNVGGIVGQLIGIIQNCYSDSTVIGNNQVGGIIGYLSTGNVLNNINEGTVISNSYIVGGIIGSSSTGNVLNNINEGTVISNSDTVGGIIGLLQTNGEIQNNINRGKVEGVQKWIGGIVGGINPVSSNITSFRAISGNVNYGEVTTKKGAYRVGGIIGEGNEGILVYNNVNYGKVDGVGDGTSASYGTGGIIGSISTDNPSFLYNNINKADIKGKISVGGIVGNSETIVNSGEVVKNVINEGTIETTTGFAGGIIGRYGDQVNNNDYVADFITNAYNKGTIKGANAAGLVGSNIGIKNSITTGTLSGTNNYGVIGNIVNGVNISNVYYPNTDTSSYGTAFDKNTLDGTMVSNVLGPAFNYDNGKINLYKANITTSGFEITNISYTNELLEK